MVSTSETQASVSLMSQGALPTVTTASSPSAVDESEAMSASGTAILGCSVVAVR